MTDRTRHRSSRMGRQTSPDGRPQIADPRRVFPWAHGLRQAAQAQVGGSGLRSAAQQTSKAVRSCDLIRGIGAVL